MKKKQDFSENRSLEDRSWDLLAEMWAMQELKRCDCTEESESQRQEMEVFFSKYDTYNMKQIDQYISTFHGDKRRKQLVRKFVQAAAVVLSVFCLSMGIAVASSANVRIQILKLLISITPEYTSLQIGQEGERPVEVPSEWHGLFYPTLVPQGLVLLDSYEEVDGYVADYGRDGSAFPVFTFSEYTEGTVNLDTEGAENIDVSIHGQNAKMFRKNDRITVYWQEGNRILMLGVSGYSEADALRFAEKIEILK